MSSQQVQLLKGSEQNSGLSLSVRNTQLSALHRFRCAKSNRGVRSQGSVRNRSEILVSICRGGRGQCI